MLLWPLCKNTKLVMKYIDLGLSVEWADCNVGATKAEEYGDYFKWNEISTLNAPSLDEIKELKSKCKWEWIQYNNVFGYRITGPNGNSIFLPAAGYRFITSLYNAGSYGRYWSATPLSYSSSACSLGFLSDRYDWGDDSRDYGFTVRPVKRTNIKNMKPITPNKVKEELALPDKVVEILNDLITENFTGTESIVSYNTIETQLQNLGYSKNMLKIVQKRVPILYKDWEVSVNKNAFVFIE